MLLRVNLTLDQNDPIQFSTYLKISSDGMDIIAAISALEMALPELRHSVPSGAGVRAAEEVLQKT